jgi:hypothetical protein
MSNGGGIIIICGTGGAELGDKTIVVYDGDVSVAIKIDKDALIAKLEENGDSHLVASRKINQFVNAVERDYWSWGEHLERLGIAYERHEPHAQP